MLHRLERLSEDRWRPKKYEKECFVRKKNVNNVKKANRRRPVNFFPFSLLRHSTPTCIRAALLSYKLRIMIIISLRRRLRSGNYASSWTWWSPTKWILLHYRERFSAFQFNQSLMHFGSSSIKRLIMSSKVLLESPFSAVLSRVTQLGRWLKHIQRRWCH